MGSGHPRLASVDGPLMDEFLEKDAREARATDKDD